MKKLENLRLIGLFSATALLGGCVSFGGAEPPPFLLSLSPDAVVAAGAEQTGPKSGAVVVRLPTTPQKLNNLRVPVQTNATGIAYLKEAVWVDKPARLFQDLLIETVSAKNGRMRSHVASCCDFHATHATLRELTELQFSHVARSLQFKNCPIRH